MSEPVFVYDDDCGFCTWWAERFAAHAAVRIVGFSELRPALRDRLPEDYEECSHLVTDERVYSCGEGIEEALLRTDPGRVGRPVVESLRGFGPYREFREWSYRRGADNRALWGKLVSKTPPARTADGEESREE
ncbi:DCC1-like thiol-disulfide oxidoreductase family protein [Haloarchaeobius amylolyticus]|uniref:DCC1-like thiol-disulfide oxidoreductase family protein n=1 Tax=Haloarchaeobius amylolyticus TaxID=1198296 RepID=UPI002271162E|nr:DCC1-like thiol-disulfide oxidoreductase family protein [Haloarchaeobius amylolyticus]